MQNQQAIIRIRDLRLRTLIGFNPEERQKPQDVVINLEIHYPFSPELRDDNVAAALNYKSVTKRIIAHVEDGQFLLLEKLVSDVMSICLDYDSVSFVRVTIDKPYALRFADSVSLTLEHRVPPAETQFMPQRVAHAK